MIPSNHDECMSSDQITQAPGLDEFGIYNSFPEPTREIPVDVFSKYISRQVIVGTETRQPRDMFYASVRVFWFEPGYGVGVSHHWVGQREMYRYWFFGCEHKLVEHKLTKIKRDQVGLFIHEYICEHCGYKITVDSSG